MARAHRPPHVSRRTLLKGIGAAALLPALPSTPAEAAPRLAPAGHVPEVIARALREAFADFERRARPDQLRQVWAAITSSHQSLVAAIRSLKKVATPNGQVAWRSDVDVRYPEIALVYSTLRGEPLDLGPAREGVMFVTPSGAIFGFQKYLSLDPGWISAAVIWLRYYLEEVPALTRVPPKLTIPNNVRIAMVGDWGTGFYRDESNKAPAQRVAEALAGVPHDLLVHLGDVYYAGLHEEDKTTFPDMIHPHFLDCWPGQPGASLAVNSNHDMYPAGRGYFEQVLGEGSPFDLQEGLPVFWLENDDWVVLGLDSARTARKATLYGDGNLDSFQIQLLRDAAATGKRLLIMCHHNGIDEDPTELHPLWDQVADAVGDAETWWYWGHAHLGTVYASIGNLHARCCGHGAVPTGYPEVLEGRPEVVWFEQDPAGDPDIDVRVMSGFSVVTLSGRTIVEQFFDETGALKYPRT